MKYYATYVHKLTENEHEQTYFYLNFCYIFGILIITYGKRKIFRENITFMRVKFLLFIKCHELDAGSDSWLRKKCLLISLTNFPNVS